MQPKRRVATNAMGRADPHPPRINRPAARAAIAIAGAAISEPIAVSVRSPLRHHLPAVRGTNSRHHALPVRTIAAMPAPQRAPTGASRAGTDGRIAAAPRPAAVIAAFNRPPSAAAIAAQPVPTGPIHAAAQMASPIRVARVQAPAALPPGPDAMWRQTRAARDPASPIHAASGQAPAGPPPVPGVMW